MSRVQSVLEEWGAWLRSKGDGQGWGGSLDLDRLFELAKRSRDPGTYSNPVAAQWEATIYDGQSRHQRVDRYVDQCGLTLSLTARLRYAGILEPTAEPDYRSRRRWVVSRETLQGCGDGAQMEMAGEMWFTESGPLPVARIAKLMEVAQGTVYGRLAHLHERIRVELAQDDAIKRKGLIYLTPYAVTHYT
jgi:hypothetical protein